MKTFKKIVAFVGIVSMTLLIPSCIGEYLDPNISMDNQITPTLTAPLVKGKITIADYISDIEGLTTDNINGFERLKFVIETDSMGSFSADDGTFSMDITESMSYGLGNMELDDIPGINASLTFQEIVDNSGGVISYLAALDGQTVPTLAAFGPLDIAGQYSADPISEFEKVTFASGTFDVTLTNNLPMPIDMVMELWTRLDGSPVMLKSFIFTSLAANGGTDSEVYDLAGETVGNEVWYENISITSQEASNVTIDLSKTVDMLVDAKNLAIESGVADLSDLNFGNISDLDTMDIDFGTDMWLSEIKLLNNNKIDLTVTNPFGFEFLLNVNIPGSTINGNELVISKTILVDPNPQVFEIDLSNAIINFDVENNVSRLIVNYDGSINTSPDPVYFNVNDELTVEFGMSFGISNVDYVTGYFGKDTIEVPSDTIPLDLDMLDMFEGDFVLTDPSIKLNLQNPMGIPIDIDFNIVGKDADDQLVDLNINNGNTINLEYPSNPGEVVDASISVDNTNSAIVDFIAALPKEITYGGNVFINPEGYTGVDNFVTSDFEVNMSMAFELPLSLKTPYFGFKDTVEMEGGIDVGEMGIDFESLELWAKVKNGFPFSIDLTLSFVDTLYNQLFILEPENQNSDLLIVAPDVDENGRIIDASIEESFVKFELTKAMFDQLPDVRHIMFQASLATPADGTKEATIYKDNYLDFALFIQNAQVTLDF